MFPQADLGEVAEPWIGKRSEQCMSELDFPQQRASGRGGLPTDKAGCSDQFAHTGHGVRGTGQEQYGSAGVHSGPQGSGGGGMKWTRDDGQSGGRFSLGDRDDGRFPIGPVDYRPSALRKSSA